jgi:hypothetical protein
MKRILVLEGEHPLSWNELYSGKHWALRQQQANRAHALVRAALNPDDPLFTRPVTIKFIVYFAHHPQDASNICSKVYEDGLVGWWLLDDGPLYVRSMTTESRVDKAHPRIVIECEEIAGDEPELLNGCVFTCAGCGRKYTQLARLLEHRESGECGGDGQECD